MNEITRRKLNSLRGQWLQLALYRDQLEAKRPLNRRQIGIAMSSGLGEAMIVRREERRAARAKNKLARASRKRNRR